MATMKELTCIACAEKYDEEDLTEEQMVLESYNFCPKCLNDLIYD